MIEKLKPEIVITDLMRNHKYSGLNIIKKYYEKKSKIRFLVVSAGNNVEVKRKAFSKTELDGVDILTAGSSAEVDKCDEMDKIFGAVTRELNQDDQNKEITE